MVKCKKCGGSGDMFMMKKGSSTIIVPFRDIKVQKEIGYKTTGATICCSMCQGIGAVEVN